MKNEVLAKLDFQLLLWSSRFRSLDPSRGVSRDRLQSGFESHIIAMCQVRYHSLRIFSMDNVLGFLAQ